MGRPGGKHASVLTRSEDRMHTESPFLDYTAPV